MLTDKKILSFRMAVPLSGTITTFQIRLIRVHLLLTIGNSPLSLAQQRCYFTAKVFATSLQTFAHLIACEAANGNLFTGLRDLFRD